LDVCQAARHASGVASVVSFRALGRLLLAHPICGAGIALLMRSDLGPAPWDVFHIGLHRATGLSIGTATSVTAVAAVLVALSAGVRPGLGTLVNAVLIGACVDGGLAVLPIAPNAFWGVAYLASGLVVFGLGTGLYMSANLGAGPRDSLMVALARGRASNIGRARAIVELAALGVGILLGGPLGWGTVTYAVAIGPVARWGINLFAEEA
jgi:uncharacterized membrane protein YczE